MNRSISLLFFAAMPALADQGDRCQPGETPPREGIECRPSHLPDGTLEWEVDPAQILNARKGDVPLSAGCGRIGTLLSKVQPAQLFGHTGIMIEDRYALRNSTGSADRILSYPVGELSHLGEPTDGFAGPVVRYGWPGSISQSIQGGYEGEWLSDPEVDGQAYLLKPFSDRADTRCEVQTPAAVMKPALDEELDHPWVRPLLEAAADESALIDSHYRVYNYTDGLVFDVAPAAAGWAAGTVPTVCSTFVRAALKAAGATLEGIVENEDCLGDASCVPGDLLRDDRDGMYHYSEAERQAAGSWLHGDILKAAEAKDASGFGEAFYDAPSDVANQFTNCFAFDWCDSVHARWSRETEPFRDLDGRSRIERCVADEPDAKDSECWRRPHIGLTTSPDDMLRWDAPRDGGVYGHMEALIMRSTRYVVVHRWQSAEGMGDVFGRVTYNGEPMPKAEVALDGVFDFTDVGGRYRLVGVPAGDAVVDVCLPMPNGTFLGGAQPVRVVAGGAVQADVSLQPVARCNVPSTHWSRLVTLGGSFTIIDHEFWVANERGTFDVPPLSVVLHPLPELNRHTFRFTECVGAEVRGEFEITVVLRAGSGEPVLDTSMRVKLREGSTCDLDEDVERTYQVEADIGPDQSHVFEETIVSNEWDSDDTIKTQIRVSNLPFDEALLQ